MKKPSSNPPQYSTKHIAVLTSIFLILIITIIWLWTALQIEQIK